MSDEPRDEYTFDYRQAKPNRFAAAVQKGGRLVVLDPEVAAAFRESGAVNAVLRALLHTMPAPPAGQAADA
jgi:hypothetical protein